MTDNLRDRIAAVIQSNVTWDAPTLSGHLADAVIRELGLHRQDNELDTTGPYRYRYVTEWINPQTNQRVNLP